MPKYGKNKKPPVLAMLNPGHMMSPTMGKKKMESKHKGMSKY